ncbi:DUF262 domain-containing protein [Prauserella oleivorans]
MKPATHTVQELFERDVRYIVPLYQRPYVWNEEEQWAPLWQDITALLNHHEDTGDHAQWSHFLGAIVLDQEQTAPGQIPRFTVIDGQQRLTTLQLLVAAAARPWPRWAPTTTPRSCVSSWATTHARPRASTC